MLLFAIGETRLLAGDIQNESDFASALSALPMGARGYLSHGKSLTARRDRLAAVRLLMELLHREGFAADAPIVRDEWGRPYFDAPALPDFNLSHSDGFVAVAIGDGKVGIDLQRVTLGFDPAPLARRFFSQEEANTIQNAPEARRPDLFFALWTKKEAIGKALGRGLTDTLGQNAAALPPCTTQKRYLNDNPYFLSVCGEDTPIEVFPKR